MVDTHDTVSELFGTEGLSREQQTLRQMLIDEGRTIRTNEEEAFDTNLDTATAEVLAKQLATEKDLGEAQLSYALHVLKENRAYLDDGYETFQEYVENKIKISGPKASALATRWENFIGLGLSSAALTQISWSKFGELVPGIKAGVIDDANIDLWLPLIASNGEHALTNKGVAMLVKADIAATKAEEDPDQETNFTIRLSADDKENILRYINTIEEATGILSAGEVVRAALESKITEIAENTEDVRKNYGLTRFKEIAERMVEGIQVVFLADPSYGYTEDTIGVVPFTKIYQSTEDPTKFTLAASQEDAAVALGGDVVGYDLTITGAQAGDELVEEEPEEEDDFAYTEEEIFSIEEPAYDLLDTKEIAEISKELLKELEGQVSRQDVSAFAATLPENINNKDKAVAICKFLFEKVAAVS